TSLPCGTDQYDPDKPGHLPGAAGRIVQSLKAHIYEQFAWLAKKAASHCSWNDVLQAMDFLQ
ncbi:hypothetical protein KUCAC02_017235, partial [Chaenocephalus aceratus]